MVRARTLLPLLVLPLLLAAADAPAPLSAKAQKALAGRTAGEPVACIPLTPSQPSNIVDATAIIYKPSNKLWYVNQPDDGRCTQLNPTRILITRTSGNQLCTNDIVMIAESGSPITYGACGLGRFVPYRK